MRTRLTLIASTSACAIVLAACSGGENGGSDDGANEGGGESTITVAYQRTDAFFQLDDLLQKCKDEFESANEGVTVELEPIAAQETEYFTALALMHGSPDTAPDVIYEDTFMVRSNAAAGYLAPMDDYLAEWEDWDQFSEAAKQAGLGDDGMTYGISMGTDTRGIYFNKELFAEAGLPEDWQPETWEDILEAARAVQDANPDVIPLNVYSSIAQGEATSMQGFEMLLYGTDDELYDFDSQQWTTGSQGFLDALTFIETAQAEELLPGLEDALDTNLPNRVSGELLPQGQLAIAVDGSWVPGGWMGDGANSWPEWEEVMGMAQMPTSQGQEPGATSMSGGWLLSLGSQASDPEAAFGFITTCLNQENSLKFATENSQIAVRDDVASDPTYLDYNPSFEFFSSLVPVTNFRPATPDYSQISNLIQVAAESVLTGQATPEQAQETYDQGVIGIVGEENTSGGS
ncbi:extracellular solute-binding protein [Bogoriella caseilytica]|uniref:Carbohydrate ABC transporter substrate-binding protein (CUT1 family) n=1 Tax=Bogoriella caseilytica TaxID=56055 RepID=A0A3N2BF06_9MICO|nr:extracellular solute-binding protein [Bogoriella caseilytica]ROR73848.1 carbohydrate ABC transporter substrate-binding protein (CUT1 family) [Bogoriella caseilytica]